MSRTEANRELVHRIYEAAASGDGNTFFGALHSDVEMHEPDCLPFGGRKRGLESVQEMYAQIAPLIEPGSLQVIDLIADEDRVVGLVRLTLTSGAEADISEHWLISDGKVVAVRAFWDDPSVLLATAE